MKYEKPEVVLLASAVHAVQGTGKNGQSGDGPFPTNPAYEADE
jgi:hypothetical protein